MYISESSTSLQIEIRYWPYSVAMLFCSQSDVGLCLFSIISNCELENGFSLFIQKTSMVPVADRLIFVKVELSELLHVLLYHKSSIRLIIYFLLQWHILESRSSKFMHFFSGQHELKYNHCLARKKSIHRRVGCWKCHLWITYSASWNSCKWWSVYSIFKV